MSIPTPVEGIPHEVRPDAATTPTQPVRRPGGATGTPARWQGWDAGRTDPVEPDPFSGFPTIRPNRAAHLRGAVVAVLGVLGFVALYAFAVRTPTGQDLDERLMQASAGSGNSALLGLVSVPTLVLTAALLAFVALMRRRPVAAGAAVGIIVLGNVLTQVLKDDLLERPAFVGHIANSLPSGHMGVVTSVLLATLLVVPPRVRLLLSLPSVAVLVLAGTALVEQGWHRPSDVLASLLVLVTLVGVMSLVPGVQADSPRRSVRRLTGLATALFAVGGLAVGLAGAAAIAAGVAPALATTGIVSSGSALAVAAVLWLGNTWTTPAYALQSYPGQTPEAPRR